MPYLRWSSLVLTCLYSATLLCEGTDSRLAGPSVRAGIVHNQTVPFAIISPSGHLVGGLQKLTFDEVAARLRGQGQFVVWPRERLATALNAGDIDMACFIDMNDLPDANLVDWSHALLYSQQIIVRRQVSSQSDPVVLHRIGTEFGVQYPVFEQAFRQRQILRSDSAALTSNLQRLIHKRVDGVLTTDLAYAALQRSLPTMPKFAIDVLPEAKIALQCAVSQSSPHRMQLLQALSRMSGEGFFAAATAKYQTL